MALPMSEECKEFLATCCTMIEDDEIINRSFVSKYYDYRGCCMPTFMLRGYFEGRKLNIDKDDILLVSLPKTGSTWLQQIAYLVYNDAKVEMETASNSKIDEKVPFIEFTIPEKVEEINRMPSPKILKTHLPFNLIPNYKQNKIIYISRNPKDTLVSYFHFVQMIKHIKYTGTFSEMLELMIRERVAFAPIHTHVIEYWEKSKTDKNVLFLRYEDLKKDLKSGIEKVANFLGKKLSDEQIATIAQRCTFESMSANTSTNFEHLDGKIFDFSKSKFMRKGVVGDWKNYFSEEDNKKMDAWIESKFGNTDLKFTYE